MKKIILSLSMLAAVGVYAQNTGIGTTNPTEKLEVAGNIKSTTINSNTGAATDKVVVADANGVLKSVARSGVDTNSWQLIGNNITAGQFIGTINNQDLIFKVNNSLSGRIQVPYSDGSFHSSSSFGFLALGNLTTGKDNSAYGYVSLYNNTDGSNNTAIGMYTQYYGKTASENTAIGREALKNNIAGNNNTAIGNYSLWGSYGISTGNNNIAIGYRSEVPNNQNSNQLSVGNSIYGLNINDGNNTNDLIGIQNTTPKETLDIAGTVKIGTKAAYSSTTITAGATTPVPDGGAGTIVFQNSHFFGWDGSAWKQLDN